MKFTALALIATASAIQIEAEAEVQGGCVDDQMSDELFKQIDTNHNG